MLFAYTKVTLAGIFKDLMWTGPEPAKNQVKNRLNKKYIKYSILWNGFQHNSTLEDGFSAAKITALDRNGLSAEITE